MSILTGKEIALMRQQGRLRIEPFDAASLAPNSYDLRLAPDLLVYTGLVLDMAKDNLTEPLLIPKEGLMLYPNRLYLGCAVESVGSEEFVPCIEGRSSVARLGISVHLTAGVGDLGFFGQFTLEITVARPVRVYPLVRIAQALFFTSQGERSSYKGKYQNQQGPVASRLWRDFVEVKT